MAIPANLRPAKFVNKNSRLVTNWSFFANGAPVIPASVVWRLHCLTNNILLSDWQAVPAAASVQIVIPATSNGIIADDNQEEIKLITVSCNIGTPQEVTQDKTYGVRNMVGR